MPVASPPSAFFSFAIAKEELEHYEQVSQVIYKKGFILAADEKDPYVQEFFAAMKSGADVDMGGEKHGIDATHVEEKTSESTAAPASAAVTPSAPVDAASAAASAASN